MDKAKPLQFSPHAKQQMEQRKIAIEMVEETMSKGTHRTGNVAGRMIAEKPYGRMTLRVVYKKFRTSILIITAIKV